MAKAHPVTTIGRIKAADYEVVMRTLETGASGLMCSMVADADEARRIVAWSKFNNPHLTGGLLMVGESRRGKLRPNP